MDTTKFTKKSFNKLESAVNCKNYQDELYNLFIYTNACHV